MKAVVFSGTTEGRVFSRQLAALGAEVLVSVATPLGAEEQGKADGITVHCGRLTPEEMTALLQGAALCIDATHPYAVDATKNIRAACAVAGVEYHRLLREESPLPAGSMVFATATHAAAFLAGCSGNVLLATGAKELAAFAALGPERLLPRVLPTREGIAACEAAGIPHKNHHCHAGAIQLCAELRPDKTILHPVSGHQGRRCRGRLCRKSTGRTGYRCTADRGASPG